MLNRLRQNILFLTVLTDYRDVISWFGSGTQLSIKGLWYTFLQEMKTPFYLISLTMTRISETSVRPLS